ncbi:MAG: right-handed parallel beta-helix repeat-containing protein [Bacteroidota bacterium]
MQSPTGSGNMVGGTIDLGNNVAMTVPSGATLELRAGAKMLFGSGTSGLTVGGMMVLPTSGQAEFRQRAPGVTWSGIVANASTQIDNVIIKHAATGIKVGGGSSTTIYKVRIDSCGTGIYTGSCPTVIQADTITNCAIGVQIKSVQPVTVASTKFDTCDIGIEILPKVPQQLRRIENCQFLNVGATAISIISFSNALLTGNSFTGPGNDNDAVALVSSSPKILGNTIAGFKYGLLCATSSSPSLEDIFAPGYNIITNNGVGVYCADQSNANLGFADEWDNGGYNSIFDNDNHDVIAENNSHVIGEENWWGSRDTPPGVFSEDGTSSFDYDPWLEDDPNQTPESAGRGDRHLSESISLMRQALQQRYEGQYGEAVQTLRMMITSGESTTREKRWAFGQMLIIAQLSPQLNLSEYLANAIANHPLLRRGIRSLLPGLLLAEGKTTQAFSALDQNMQDYPNSAEHRSALYMKFIYRLHEEENLVAAQSLFSQLSSSYPESIEKRLAQAQLAGYIASRPVATPDLGRPSATDVPSEYRLLQNYPNPFNPVTMINYHLPTNNWISLKVYDVLGREVLTLVDGEKEAGTHSVQMDGNGLSSGIYFYTMRVGEFVNTRKLLLLK